MNSGLLSTVHIQGRMKGIPSEPEEGVGEEERKEECGPASLGLKLPLGPLMTTPWLQQGCAWWPGSVMPAAVVVTIKAISHSRRAALCLLVDLHKHCLRVFVQLSPSFCLPPACLSL